MYAIKKKVLTLSTGLNTHGARNFVHETESLKTLFS